MTEQHYWSLLSDTDKNAHSSISIYKCPTRRAGIARCNTNSDPNGWSHNWGAGPRGDYAMVWVGNRAMGGNAAIDAYWLNKIDGSWENEGSGPFRITDANNSWRPVVSFTHWRDGLSNQFVIGEKHIPMGVLGMDTRRSADVDGSMFGFAPERAGWGSTAGDSGNRAGRFGPVRTIITRTPRLARGPQDSNTGGNAAGRPETGGTNPISDLAFNDPAYGFGSYHTGICNFLIGDGGVRSVPVTTSSGTLYSFSSVNDGGSTSL